MFCSGKRQKRFSCYKCQGTMAKTCHYKLIKFFVPQNDSKVTTKEGKKRRSNIKKKTKTKKLPKCPSFQCMTTSLGPCSDLHLLIGPKTFKNCVFWKSDDGNVTVKKCRLTWDSLDGWKPSTRSDEMVERGGWKQQVGGWNVFYTERIKALVMSTLRNLKRGVLKLSTTT